jgi:hypothetical protein
MPGQLASIGAGDRHLLWECRLLGGHGVSVGENADLVLVPRTSCRRDTQRMRSVGWIAVMTSLLLISSLNSS